MRPYHANTLSPAALVLVAAGHFSCPPPHVIPPGLVTYTYDVVETFPHDADAFTQGLVYDNGVLYEGTGLNGASTLRRVTLETGEVVQSVALASTFFGEGIVVYGDTILQLTWRNNRGFVYDKESFDFLGEFTYPTEGWGITHDGNRLIMSDGTATIRFRDPETFDEIGSIDVRDDNGPIIRLNELEYIDGRIWANVWLTDFIAIIDPETGNVEGWIDLTGLRPTETLGNSSSVLNGIAYDAENDRLLVTGKNWPSLFHIELVPIDE